MATNNTTTDTSIAAVSSTNAAAANPISCAVVASSGVNTASSSTQSSKWTVVASLDSQKRQIRPPTSDDYNEWTLEQLKLCTARKLKVPKNTKKDERIKILVAWDTDRDAVEVLLRRHRKRVADGRSEEDKRTKGCMFRLMNILFSDRFFESFLATRNQPRREEIGQGGSTFWTDVAAAFASDSGEFDAIISEDSVFEDIDASNLARAEAGSKISGQDFCDGRADVFYLHQWCEHRQGGREFCAPNVYPEDEDYSTKEGQQRPQQVNRKRRRESQAESVAAIFDRVNDILDAETTQPSKTQEETWNEQTLFLQEQRAAQKLVTLCSMLERNVVEFQRLLQRRNEYAEKGPRSDMN
ncbi:hypothetical protein PHMEG_00034974 [Phytophthora megakarya]|uniref:Uncharacterized protein n=1 Tax=Phytophthora megakarya TaxID=4795 RepID=A0A225USC9_9STRA|nr:hypothetical protein PHMEG_00034974 [Phytophthora megakarya]